MLYPSQMFQLLQDCRPYVLVFRRPFAAAASWQVTYSNELSSGALTFLCFFLIQEQRQKVRSPSTLWPRYSHPLQRSTQLQEHDTVILTSEIRKTKS